MKDQKSPPDLAFVRQQIERLVAELAIWKNTEQGLLAVKDGEFAMGLKDVFKGMRAIDAICEFLKRERRPMPRQSIIRGVIEGGAKLGANKQKSVNQSISTNMGKKLREMNGLIGLMWPDEKFRVDR